MERKIEQKLLQWKESPKRMPLILNGARQVGKTFILNQFGAFHYKNVVHINLEADFRAREVFETDLRAKSIIERLQVVESKTIDKHSTLLIFDEIQASERALTSLKSFCEEELDYHVVAAGSLLGVAINREKFSFPVGKVDELNMYPLDFEEFLWAVGKKGLANFIRHHYQSNEPLDEALHQEAVMWYRKYLITGGMPAVVAEYVDSQNFNNVSEIQHRILNEYVADMAKYADSRTAVKIRACYNSVPSQLAKENHKFQYKVVQKGGSATIFGESVEWLSSAGVVLKCQAVTQGTIPLAVFLDFSDFKLYLSDTGLLTMKAQMPHSLILSDNPIGGTFIGALTENYVAQSLTSNGFPLYYWKSDNRAELDFVIQKGEYVIPLEVKSGVNVKSKSLGVFNSRYDIQKSIRTSLRNFGFENDIKSVPLYALFCLEKENQM
ncbi:MAG: ATP-binding protein [Bacteroidales bacterium]|nr:ATP-binding protein [Bacteroidales bacterium]